MKYSKLFVYFPPKLGGVSSHSFGTSWTRKIGLCLHLNGSRKPNDEVTSSMTRAWWLKTGKSCVNVHVVLLVCLNEEHLCMFSR